MLLLKGIRRLNFFLLAVFISSCAQITAPTGGERDQVAPEVVEEIPPNRSTNFNSKTIEIIFNEFMQVQNPQNIVISPALDPAPEISAKKKVLTVKFKKELEPNTTYSIFFGSNVGDANENNKLENYSYVFSTGSFLDSLQVSGIIKTADGQIPDNSFLLLYKEQDDSAFLSKRPFYLAKIESDGSAKLEHVKAGTYKIYTLTDKNLNYYYDLPTELIGFADSAFTINGNFDSLELPLFLPEESSLRIVEFDKSISGGIFNFKMNKEISFTDDEITVSVSEDTTLQTAAFQEADNRQVKVYFTNLSRDSGNYTLILKNNNQLIDSFRIRVQGSKFKTPVVFFADSNALKNITVLETQPLKLQSAYYSLSPVDTSKIELKDSLQNQIPFSIARDADLKTYIIHADWKDKMEYQLTFQDSATSDLAGNFLKKQTIRFSAVSRKKGGTLTVRTELPQTSHQSVIIVKDNSGKILKSQVVRDSQVVHTTFGLLPSGNYFVEVIDDINNNGIWNSGNFSKKTLPERIYKHDKPILIKENWDAEETIKVDFSKKPPVLLSGDVDSTQSPVKNKLTLPGKNLQKD